MFASKNGRTNFCNHASIKNLNPILKQKFSFYFYQRPEVHIVLFLSNYILSYKHQVIKVVVATVLVLQVRKLK